MTFDLGNIIVSIHAPAWGATHPGRGRHRRGQVSIHAPAWGATGFLVPPRGFVVVSIHAPAWGATAPVALGARPERCFNPRSRVGSDAGMMCPFNPQPSFNPRSRVGSDCPRGSCAPTRHQFQSTLPRGERRCANCATGGSMNVSIHAPAWGATKPVGTKYSTYWVSIHAPAWGATLQQRQALRYLCGFNPRSRVGSDGRGRVWAGVGCRFNPRSRVGSDTIPTGMAPLLSRFQSTLPRGERPGQQGAWRGDIHVSIHAPAWGATGEIRPAFWQVERFNPRSRVGSDFCKVGNGAPFLRFQSTLPRGERPI